MKKLKIADLLDYPFLLQKEPSNSRKFADSYCSENSVEINTVMNIARSNLLIDFVKIGYGIGYVTKLYVSEELEKEKLYELNVKPKPRKIEYGIITIEGNGLQYSCRKFIKHLKKEI